MLPANLPSLPFSPIRVFRHSRGCYHSNITTLAINAINAGGKTSKLRVCDKLNVVLLIGIVIAINIIHKIYLKYQSSVQLSTMSP